MILCSRLFHSVTRKECDKGPYHTLKLNGGEVLFTQKSGCWTSNEIPSAVALVGDGYA
jgi:hypothetical protein